MQQVLTNLKSFVVKSNRVWHVLRKPTKEEFQTTAKVSAIGILVIGLFGFLIAMAMLAFIR
jgi:protein translocase SEC61 complex gamma subunit